MSSPAPTTQKYPPMPKPWDSLERDPFGLLPLNRQVRETKNVVLQWSNAQGELVRWEWPELNLMDVAPHELTGHYITHAFRFPSCLCARASIDPDTVTECAVFVRASGGLQGRVIAACARKNCHYWVDLSAVFSRKGEGENWLSREYPRRTATELLRSTHLLESIVASDFETPSSSPPDMDTTQPQPHPRTSVKRVADSASNSPLTAESSKRAGKRPRIEYIDRSSDIKASSGIRNVSPPPASEATSFSLMMRLDDGGLSLREFNKLFVVCKLCTDWIGTPSALETHYCPIHRLTPLNELIDLTEDSD